MGLGRTAGGLGITLMVVFLRASKSANCRYGIFNIYWQHRQMTRCSSGGVVRFTACDLGCERAET